MSKDICKQVNDDGIRVFMGTITDRTNVHEALTAVSQQHNITAATFELLGGVYEVELTAYDFTAQERREPLIFTKPLEIIAGHGTISMLDNAPHVHIHMSLAFRDENMANGIAVIGGHVARAEAFAVEYTLIAYDGVGMARKFHRGTGLKLWQ